jgi:hypothetical protein
MRRGDALRWHLVCVQQGLPVCSVGPVNSVGPDLKVRRVGGGKCAALELWNGWFFAASYLLLVCGEARITVSRRVLAADDALARYHSVWSISVPLWSK